MICNILLATLLVAGTGPTRHFHNVFPECGNVFSITQDDDLNMWFGTNTGFYRYDGYNNTKYTFGFYFSIADANRIYRTGIYRDEKGGIWASYKNLYKFDKRSSSFLQIDSINEDGITDVVDYNGVMLLACDSGIKAVGRESLEPRTLPEGLRDVKPYKFYVSDHSLYVITKDYRILRFSAITAKPNLIYDISFFRNYPVDIAVSGGNIWIAADGGGIASINELGECKRYNHTGASTSLCSDFVRSIAFDSGGNLWASTGSGLSILDKFGRFSSYQPNNDTKWSLSKKSLIKIFRDADGGMWIGSVGGGVDYCCSDGALFSTVNLGEQFEDVIGPLSEDSDGSLWIGTSRSGVFHYFPNTGEYSQFIFDSSSEMNDVKCIHFSKDGKKIFFGFARNEIAIMDRRSHKISMLHPFSSSLTILNILEDRNGDIWFGTGDGIFLFNMSTGLAVRADGQPSSMYITSMRLGEGDTCRFCAFDKLFSCKLSNGIDGPTVSFLSEDSRFGSARHIVGNQDGIMVASDCGLMIDCGGQAKVYSVEDGLSSSNVNSALKDSRGRIWAGTRNGLNMIDAESGRITRYYDFDNLPSNYFSVNSCLSASDGTLYFGTVNGLTRFNPDVVGYDRPSHTPHVAYLSISGRKHSPEPDGKYIINPGLSFSIVYGVSNYSSLNQDVFFYRLLPSGQDWIKTGPGNSITFSNLKHGRYTFELKSENAYGNVSDSSESVLIVVKPFWYQTLFAKILYFVALMLVLTYCAIKIKNTVRRHYELKIKHVEELSAETILENNARSISSHFLTPEELSVLEKVIVSIQSQLHDPEYSIERLANDMCMSRSNLHRKIKSMTGLSATDLLQKYRMEKSAELLSQTDYSVETISEMVGYSSASYFIQAFKKFYHTTPGKLR